MSDWDTCKRKKPFDKRSEAMKVMQNMNRYLGAKDLNVYKCPVCKHFHIGHRRKKNNE